MTTPLSQQPGHYPRVIERPGWHASNVVGHQVRHRCRIHPHFQRHQLKFGRRHFVADRPAVNVSMTGKTIGKENGSGMMEAEKSGCDRIGEDSTDRTRSHLLHHGGSPKGC
jgi:hypothetical protein